MKRFFFENEDDDEEDMMDDADRMIPEFVPEFFALPHTQENPAHHILNCSMKICEQSFLWNFMSIDKKMKMISQVFDKLNSLVGGAEDAEDPDAKV